MIRLSDYFHYHGEYQGISWEKVRRIRKRELKSKESLIKNIFGSGGKATLSVVDKHGKHYIVSRIYGEQSNVIDENGLDLNIQPSSLFDGIQYFGQKDLSNSADHENGLLEKLVGGKIGKSAEITSCVKELTTSVSQLLDANKIPEQIEECKIKESEVEHKMSIYKEKGVAEKLKKQTGYTTDKAKLDSVKGRIDSAVRELKKCYDNNKDVTLGLQGVESVYNSDIIKKASDILSAIGNEILKIGEAVTQIESNSLEFADVVEMLSKKIDGLQKVYLQFCFSHTQGHKNYTHSSPAGFSSGWHQSSSAQKAAPLDGNFIAAMLTILGYSINDTVVVYDRIRENRSPMGKKSTFEELVNHSVNQSARRTVITTVTTVMALGVMCIISKLYGLDSIFTFAFPLMMGMISGVYTSLCVSTSAWVVWSERKKADKN